MRSAFFWGTSEEHRSHPFCLLFSYGCETWSLTLREEQRLRVFEDRVPRKLFGPKREDVSGD
jgi:hypothetical protein